MSGTKESKPPAGKATGATGKTEPPSLPKKGVAPPPKKLGPKPKISEELLAAIRQFKQKQQSPGTPTAPGTGKSKATKSTPAATAGRTIQGKDEAKRPR